MIQSKILSGVNPFSNFCFIAFLLLGQCSNKECPFLHLNPADKIKDCPWYDRGFCKHGKIVYTRFHQILANVSHTFSIKGGQARACFGHLLCTVLAHRLFKTLNFHAV